MLIILSILSIPLIAMLFEFLSQSLLTRDALTIIRFCLTASKNLSKLSAIPSSFNLRSSSGSKLSIINPTRSCSNRLDSFIIKEQSFCNESRGFFSRCAAIYKSRICSFHKFRDSFFIADVFWRCSIIVFSNSSLTFFAAMPAAFIAFSSATCAKSCLSLSTAISTFLSHNLFNTKASMPEPKPMMATMAIKAQL